jgi:translocation and assembly module TamB
VRRFGRTALRISAVFVAALSLVLLAGVLVLRTEWFRDRVRERIVSEVQDATGGRTEIGAFNFDWRTLTAAVRDFTLHGTEAAGEKPLLRADAITVRLRILSLLGGRRVNLEEVAIRKPEANIIVYADGHTNFPTPPRARAQTSDPIKTILDLAIGHFSLTGGSLQFSARKIPLEVSGEDLRTQIFFASGKYRGEVSFEKLVMSPGSRPPVPLDMRARFELGPNELSVQELHLVLERSVFDARGSVTHFADPRAEIEYTAKILATDVRPLLGFAGAPSAGSIEASGRATLAGGQYGATARVRASGIAIEPRPGLRLTGLSASADVRADANGLEMTNMVAGALGGRFEGSGALAAFRELSINGTARGFAVERLAAAAGLREPPWTGSISGPIRIAGDLGGSLKSWRVQAALTVAPGEGPNPLEGVLNGRVERGAVELDRSYLATRSSRIEVTGAPKGKIEVSLRTSDLRDIEAVIEMASGRAAALPVALRAGGSLTFYGVVTGALDSASVRGRAEAVHFTVEGHDVDSASAVVEASASGVSARQVVISRGAMRAAGWARVGLDNWKAGEQSPIAGEITLQAPDAAAALAELKRDEPVSGGPVVATATLSGTVGNPEAAGRVRATRLVAWKQPLTSVDAHFRYREGIIELAPALARAGNAEVRLAGSYEYKPGRASEGRARFELSAPGVRLDALTAVTEQHAGVAGRIEAQMKGDLNIAGGGVRVNALNGWAAVRDVALEKQQLGWMRVDAASDADHAKLTLDGRLLGSKVTGNAECALAGDYPVKGSIDIAAFNFATLIERLRALPPKEALPFEGLAAGHIDFTGSATKPQTLAGALRITHFEMRTDPGAVEVANAERMVLRNSGPMLIDFTTKTAEIRQAVLEGPRTNLTLGGRVSFASKNPFDLRIRGEADLAVLSDLKPRLESSGMMVLDVSVRGRPSQPDIYGRVDIKDASFNWPGLPNGIDHANGLVFIYRDRASIDSLTAETGGGKVNLTGFIGFGADPTFHIQAKAQHVRVRYPEGVSSSADANLTLTGTTERSMLSGDITITRVGFNPRSDLASILASTAEPIETPSDPNPLLQGMQLNIHIVTSPQVRLETKMTRDIQADADLRLRGDMMRPVVLGRVSINQGEVLFFGNQYEIQSGQILFVNASKIEPVVNLDLQTSARSIDITLHVSGPVNRLNVTYSSDPPMQFSDIVALLATGREPANSAALTGTQTASQQSWQQAGASAILSQALANPLAGRLQRFFGVSRLKIDPSISGITTNNAAARVTLEQQITRSITLTYITDLSRPQSQSIRVEWDFTKSWSGVAQREENGLFGIDFLYKKQFK